MPVYFGMKDEAKEEEEEMTFKIVDCVVSEFQAFISLPLTPSDKRFITFKDLDSVKDSFFALLNFSETGRRKVKKLFFASLSQKLKLRFKSSTALNNGFISRIIIFSPSF